MKVPSAPRIILGIDPGTTVMGYGLLQITNQTPEMLSMGVIDLKKIKNHYAKLQRIFERTLSLIDEFHPGEVAIEAPFFGKNVQSMLKLGRGQGVAMAAALYRNLPITEYAPLKIKMAITGSGNASKEQVADMLRRMLHIPAENMIERLDATDGLAAALCHYYQTNRVQSETPFANWKEYIAKNKEKLIQK
jgi:crossover junction endodeoxyribonuclease RuvC